MDAYTYRTVVTLRSPDTGRTYNTHERYFTGDQASEALQYTWTQGAHGTASLYCLRTGYLVASCEGERRVMTY